MMKALPFISAVFTTLVNCLLLAYTNQLLLALGWLVAGSWIALIGYTYWKNKELPMVGPLDYQEGTNQFGRTCAAVGMTLIYLIAVMTDQQIYRLWTAISLKIFERLTSAM
jgi:hypothetical protein